MGRDEMSSSHERTKLFLDFLDKVQNDYAERSNKASARGLSRRTSSNTPALPTRNKIDRKLEKKITYMTEHVAMLEESLVDAQKTLKEKRTTPPADIEWNLIEEVSNELQDALGSYDDKAVTGDVSKLVSAMNRFLTAESQFRDKIQRESVEVAFAKNIECAENTMKQGQENEQALLEAEASVRYLNYKKYIVGKLSASASNDSKILGKLKMAQDLNRHQIIENIKKTETDIVELKNSLQRKVQKRLSKDKQLALSRKHCDNIAHLNVVLSRQQALLSQLDLQKVRYESVSMSVENDRKQVISLQRRVDMVKQLLKNDADSTVKLQGIADFESCGDYCPSQRPSSHSVDERDKLLTFVSHVLMNKNQEIAIDGVSVDSLISTAFTVKESLDRNMVEFARELVTTQEAVHSTEHRLTCLTDMSYNLHDTSSSMSLRDQFQNHNKHKSKVTALLSDLKMKVDTRYVRTSFDKLTLTHFIFHCTFITAEMV